MRKRNLLLAGLVAALHVGHCSASTLEAVQHDALLAIYNGTSGPDWRHRENWPDATISECSWYGVTCDATSTQVIALDLASNGLAGAFPDVLTAFPALRQVFVYSNQLTGPLPSLPAHVETFVAFENAFTGTLPALGGKTSLRVYAVELNQLSGALPALTGLTALEVFSVDSNQLTGPMPSLDGLTRLGVLGVSANHLSGALPSLEGSKNLVVFNARNNRLSGEIPVLAGLTHLQEFSAGANLLSGPIPALAGMSSLQRIELDHNALEGPIPPLDGLINLDLLALDGNRLDGAIPPSLSDLPSLRRLHVEDNRLSGPIPAAPRSLQAARLCPNPLDISPSADAAIDAGWDAATATSPWWRDCDALFSQGFE